MLWLVGCRKTCAKVSRWWPFKRVVPSIFLLSIWRRWANGPIVALPTARGLPRVPEQHHCPIPRNKFDHGWCDPRTQSKSRRNPRPPAALGSAPSSAVRRRTTSSKRQLRMVPVSQVGVPRVTDQSVVNQGSSSLSATRAVGDHRRRRGRGVGCAGNSVVR